MKDIKPLFTGGGPNWEINLYNLTSYDPKIISNILTILKRYDANQYYSASFRDIDWEDATYKKFCDSSTYIELTDYPSLVAIEPYINQKVVEDIKIIKYFNKIPVVMGLFPFFNEDGSVEYTIWINHYDFIENKIFDESSVINNFNDLINIFKELVAKGNFLYGGLDLEVTIFPDISALISEDAYLPTTWGYYSEKIIKLVGKERLLDLLEESNFEIMAGKGIFFSWFNHPNIDKTNESHSKFRNFIQRIPGDTFLELSPPT
jgi:hypothetical protein